VISDQSSSSGTTTLTVAQAGNSTFGGTIRDGFKSTLLAFAYTGTGRLTLTGSNTYSGPTTVTGGTLVAGGTNVFSPNSSVTVGGGVLDVEGYPQTINALSIGSSGALNLGIGNILTSATANLGGTLNVYGFPSSGTESVMNYLSYSGSFSSTRLPAGYVLQYTPTALDLVLNGQTWAAAINGNWSDGTKWGGSPPNGVGQGAVLNPATTAALTITLDEPVTLSMLQLGNSGGNSAVGYTISGSGTNGLTLDNNGSAALIGVLEGTHAIAAPVEIAGGNLAIVLSRSGVLRITGNLTDDNGQESLTLAGDGSGRLIVSGSDTYGGGTIVAAGTLIVSGSSALLNGSSLTVGDAAALYVAAAPAFGVAAVPAAPSAAAVATVPEPSTFVLLSVAALLATAVVLRRKEKTR
jgi:autotransporter-associated beta strand protein